MSDRRKLAVALGILVVAAAAVVNGSWHAPAAFGGPSLAVAIGAAPDQHLLTASLWSRFAAHCNMDAGCIARANVAVFAIAIAAAAWMLFRLRQSTMLVWVGAAAILALSPFAPAIVVDPLGAENFVTFVLVIAAVGELAAAWTLPAPLFFLVIFFLGLQDLPLALCIAVPALYSTSRRSSRDVAFWCATLVAVAVARVAVAWIAPHQSAWYELNATAFPVTVVIFGAIIFGVLPAALYAGRAGGFRALAVRNTNAIAPMAAGIGCIAAGVFATSGDPSFYWLCASAALLAAAILAFDAPVSTRILQGAFVVSIAAELLLGGKVYGWTVNPAIAQESAEIRDLMASEKAGASFCGTGSDITGLRLLARGALVRTYGKRGDTFVLADKPEACLKTPERFAAFVNVEKRYATEWRALGLSLLGTKKSLALISVPKSNKAGRGAFANVTDSPVGLQPAFTIVANASFVVACPARWANRQLSFAAGNPIAAHPGANPVRFRVEARAGARLIVIAEDTFVPAAGPTRWKYYRVRLPRAAGCSQLAFLVTPPTGRSVATWVSFVNAAVR